MRCPAPLNETCKKATRHELTVTFLIEDDGNEGLEQLRFTLIDQLCAMAYEMQPLLFNQEGEESDSHVLAVRGSWETAEWPK